MGKWLIIAGVCLALLGLALSYAPWLLNWFGKLPGDINIRSGSSRIFIPVTSMLLVSLIVTLLVNWFFKK